MQDNFKAAAPDANASNNGQKENALNEALRQIITESVFAGAAITETKAQIKAEAKMEAEALRYLLNRLGITIICLIFGLCLGWIIGSHDRRIGLLEQNLVLVETHLRADRITRQESSEESQAAGDITIR